MTFYMADAAFVFNQHNLVSFILRCNQDRSVSILLCRNVKRAMTSIGHRRDRANDRGVHPITMDDIVVSYLKTRIVLEPVISHVT